MSDIRDIKPLGPAWPVTPADKDKEKNKQKTRREPRPSGDENSTDKGTENGDAPGQIDEYA